MHEPAEAPIQDNGLTLRDELALDRTVLANERTLLAYVRTALGFLILGMAFLHYLEKLYFHVLGFAFMVAAAVVLGVGVHRFLSIARQVRATRGKQNGPTCDAPRE